MQIKAKELRALIDEALRVHVLPTLKIESATVGIAKNSGDAEVVTITGLVLTEYGAVQIRVNSTHKNVSKLSFMDIE